MDEQTGKTSKVLTLLVAFLIAVVAFQTYYLVRVHNRLENPTSGTVQASAKDPDVESWCLSPSTPSPDPVDPFLSAPIDPNSWDPFKEMEAMHKQMDQLFNQAFGRFQTSPRFGSLIDNFSFNPNADITEEDNAYIVRMDIPGTDSSRIKANIEGRTLTIAGTREEEVSNQNKTGGLWHKERRLGRFERSLTLPGPVNQEGIDAKYKNGVLTITIPKGEAPTKSGSILIQ